MTVWPIIVKMIAVCLIIELDAFRPQRSSLPSTDKKLIYCRSRGRATLHVLANFAKSLKITQGHSKLNRWVERVSFY